MTCIVYISCKLNREFLTALSLYLLLLTLQASLIKMRSYLSFASVGWSADLWTSSNDIFLSYSLHSCCEPNASPWWKIKKAVSRYCKIETTLKSWTYWCWSLKNPGAMFLSVEKEQDFDGLFLKFIAKCECGSTGPYCLISGITFFHHDA